MSRWVHNLEFLYLGENFREDCLFSLVEPLVDFAVALWIGSPLSLQVVDVADPIP